MPRATADPNSLSFTRGLTRNTAKVAARTNPAAITPPVAKAACAAWDGADPELAGRLLAGAVQLACKLGYA